VATANRKLEDGCRRNVRVDRQRGPTGGVR